MIGIGISRRGKHTKIVIKECIICGTPIIVKLSHSTKQGIYCSKKCQVEGYKLLNKGINNPNWKGGLVGGVCKNCGIYIEIPHALIGKKKFCSGSCSAMYRTKNSQNYRKFFKGGKRDDLNGLFVRSSWEANYARYLNWLVGLGEINGWEYEAEEFSFPNIKRGSCSYLPDFKIINNDGSVEYHEIKGYMDPRSVTKLKRMAKYHPDIKLILIDKDIYSVLAKQLKNLIPNWEEG